MRRALGLGALFLASMFLAGFGHAQTPSPLQEWQYSGGIALYRLYVSDSPEWQIETGAAVQPRPVYEGAKTYRELTGPVIDIRYGDLAFASVGEGLGVNVVRGDNYRAGIAVGYDLGRQARVDLDQLKGMGNISAAPVVKVFGSYVFSKEVPLVLRMDVRQFAGGADGAVADVEAYLPLPGSSATFIMFAGPSVTFADRLHLQTLFGVNGNQARASGYSNYQAHGGAESTGVGFSATRFFGSRWLINGNLAVNRLLGSAAASPITQSKVQGVFVASFAYKW